MKTQTAVLPQSSTRQTTRTRFQFRPPAALAVLAALLTLIAVTAQAVTYTNTTTGNWSTAANWDSSSAPSAGGAFDTIIQFSPTADLDSTNDLSGAFNLNQMILTAAFATTNTAAGGSSLLFTNNGATLPLLTNAAATTLAINSPVTLGTNLTVGVVASGTILINGDISGIALTNNLTKTGAGTLTLGGANTYSNATTISAGTLRLANTLAVQNSSLVSVGANTLQLGTDTAFTQGSGTALSINGGTITSDRATAGAGLTNAFAGNLAASHATHNFTAGANVTSGTAAIQIASMTCASGSGGNLTFNPTTASLIIVGNATGANTGTSGFILGGTNQGNSIGGAIENGTRTTQSVTKNNTSTWTLSGANTYTGDTTISAGTLALTGGGTLVNTPNIIVASAATFDVSTPTTALTLGSGQTLKASATGATTTGTVIGGSGKGLTIGAGGINFTAIGATLGTAPLTASGAAGAITFSSGAPVTITHGALVPGTYTLIDTAAAGTVVLTSGSFGTLTVNGVTNLPGYSVQVTAGKLTYTIPTYAVTYDGNGFTGGSVPIDGTAYSPNATVTVLANSGSLVKTSFTFAGWNTAADGSGVNYTAGSSTFVIKANTTLYAQWRQNQYWDDNGTAAGTTATPNGTWGSDAFWSTDSTGANVGPAVFSVAVANLDNVFFSAGTDAVNAYTVSLNGALRAPKSVTFEDGTVTLTNGNLSLNAGGGITVADTTVAGATIGTSNQITGANTFNVAASRTLTLNGPTFVRGTRAVLNVQGAGTVTSTMTNLRSADITNSIVGPWASFDTGANTKYATFSGDNILGLTGTAAADATAVTDTTGTFNYDVAAVGTLGAGANINTLRYTGAAGTIAGPLTTKGIMNAGTGTLTNSGPVTAGASGTEMVLNAASGNIVFTSTNIGTLTKTGSGTVTLAGVTNSIGSWTVNEGTLQLNNAANDGLPGGTVNSGGTVKLSGANTRVSNGATITVNAGGTLDLNQTTDQIGAISGSGSIINSAANTCNVHLNTTGNNTFSGVMSGGYGGALGIIINGVGGTQALTGTNTYTGVTDIRQGTLSIKTIKNVGVASSLGAPALAQATILFGSTTVTGTLLYTGTGDDSDRVLNLNGTTGGATLTQSGASGLLKFTAPLTATGIGSKTLTLQGSTNGTGEIAGAIVNNATTGTTTTTATNNGLAWLTLASVDGLTVGNGISGTGIPALTTITGITNATKTVALSAVATVASGVTITSSGLVNITSLTKAGTGTWTVSGANTYSGATTISAGTLKLGAPGVIPDGTGKGNVAVAGTLDLNGFAETINGLSGAGTVDNTAATSNATFTVAGPGTFSGTIQNSGSGATLALVKASGSDWILTGINTYSGGTTVNGGRLFISGPSALTTNGSVQVNNGGTLNLNVSGSPTFNQSLTLASGANLAVRLAATLGNVALPTAGTVIFNRDDQTTVAFSLGSSVALTNALTFQVGGAAGTPGAVTLAGVISGGFGLTKTSSGTLILAATNTYTGNTTVSNGTLAIAVASIATGSTVSVVEGAVLQLDFPGTNAVTGFVTNGVSLAPGVYGATEVAPFITGPGSLEVVPAGPVYPPATLLTNSFNGTLLSLSWPAGQGWRLQEQTNSRSVGLRTNWVYVTDNSVSITNITVDKTKPTTFYRLVYP